MSFLDTVKAKVGKEAYLDIEKKAEKEVALAMQMPLRDQYHQENHYRLPFHGEFPNADLLNAFECFERAGLKVSPTDLIKILFNCKLLFACQSEHEFGQRRGGLFPMLEDSALITRWSEKSEGIDVLIE